MNQENKQIMTRQERVVAFREYMLQNKSKIEAALVADLDLNRFLNVLWVQTQMNPDLVYCTPQSIFRCVLACAQHGLYPDGVTGHAFIIPRKIRGVETATLQIGYQGMVDLFRRSGYSAPKAAAGRVVHEKDEFDYEYGDNQFLRHKPSKDADPGAIVAYWAMFRYKDDKPEFEVMTLEQALAHRERYAPRNRENRLVGPWKEEAGTDEFDAMAIKTCLRRCAKLAPGPELRKLVAYDEQAEAGVEQKIENVATVADLPDFETAPPQAVIEQEAAKPKSPTEALKEKMKKDKEAKEGEEKKKAGRPKGSKNKPKGGEEPPPPDDSDDPKGNGNGAEGKDGKCKHGNEGDCHQCADEELAQGSLI